MFTVTMDSGYPMDNIPTRVHKYKPSYPLSFADGHVESFEILCADTLAWQAGDADPNKIVSGGQPNQDLINLRNAAYIQP